MLHNRHMQSITGTGVWAHTLRYGDPARAADAASELEQLGYKALWIPDVGGELFQAVENLLRATSSITVATGILNIWMHTPDLAAAEHARLTAEYGDRVLVGLGVSHSAVIDRAEPGRYTKPLQRMTEYLDGLDRATIALKPQNRLLAALGPKMLQLAGDRTAGSHPYLVTPEHTANARAALGPDKLVASEQAVVLETDANAARTIARQHLSVYALLPNYTNNWRRIGFTDDDLSGGLSDRLVDAFVVWGDEAAIAQRVQAHRDAGADHVCIQVLQADQGTQALEQWRALAPALNH